MEPRRRTLVQSVPSARHSTICPIMLGIAAALQLRHVVNRRRKTAKRDWCFPLVAGVIAARRVDNCEFCGRGFRRGQGLGDSFVPAASSGCPIGPRYCVECGLKINRQKLRPLHRNAVPSLRPHVARPPPRLDKLECWNVGSCFRAVCCRLRFLTTICQRQDSLHAASPHPVFQSGLGVQKVKSRESNRCQSSKNRVRSAKT